MSFKKLVRAPVDNNFIGADKNNCSLKDDKISKLLWFKGKLNNQLFDILLDCGASTCCIAKRCVTSNHVLNKLPRFPYPGLGLVDINGNPLVAENIIRLNFCVGLPEISLDIDFVIVSELPYSCIAGTNLLNKLKSRGVDNNSSTLYLDFSAVKLFSDPQYDNQVNLIIRKKMTLLPGETKIIKTFAVGSAIRANRPITSTTLFTEGNSEYENRTSVCVYPSLNNIGENNSNIVTIAVKNT